MCKNVFAQERQEQGAATPGVEADIAHFSQFLCDALAEMRKGGLT